MLMQIIAERLARISVKFDAKGNDGWNFVRALIIHATGLKPKEHDSAIEFCKSGLAALGLLQEVPPGPGVYKPTRRLRDLILRRCLQQPVEAARA
jgi:hypothetical protein